MSEMQSIKKIAVLTEEIKDHITFNANTESYRDIPGEYDYSNLRFIKNINWDKMPQSYIDAAQKNLDILAERVEAFNKRTGPRVGDYLSLPHGIMTRFTHDWDDSLQIGGGSGSYYLGHGYLEYSGSLDPSIDKVHMIQTDEVKDGLVWFFHEGWAGGGRGVYFKIPFRVFKLVDSYDTSTIWMVRDKEREIYREKAETITRINGNGQPYTLPVPEIMIIGLPDKDIMAIEEKTGLKFEPYSSGMRTQPLTFKEYEQVKAMYKWSKETFYNNATWHNMMMLIYPKK